MSDASDLGPLLETYSQPGSGLVRFEARGMGTVNVFLLGGDDEEHLQSAAQEAFEILWRLEEALSKFRPGSEVSLVNLLAARQPVRIGKDLFRLLALAREAWELTGGAFDPTVAPLLKAWGFLDLEGRIPSEVEVASLLEARGMNHVLLDERESTVCFDRPGVALDLGGIGKGYAVDQMTRRLQELDIAVGAVIAGRSSVRTWGSFQGEEYWRFEVVHPREQEAALATFLAEPGAVSSSGSYERHVFAGGAEVGHILDPRTGRPAAALLGATVWTKSAVLGDVLSTALFVLGKEAMARAGPVEKLLGAWRGAEEEPRASIFLVGQDPGRWGGVELEVFHVGKPAVELAQEP